MLEAIERGWKTVHRVIVEASNSAVKPGSFIGLNLDSGRRRVLSDVRGSVELRARCAFASGDVRAVSVTPTINPGDLYWIAGDKGTLAGSRWTLEVTDVEVARVQDMSDDDAREEGVINAPKPREAFERLWAKRRRGSHYWRSNPWVWVVRFRVHAGNVRKLFAEET